MNRDACKGCPREMFVCGGKVMTKMKIRDVTRGKRQGGVLATRVTQPESQLED